MSKWLRELNNFSTGLYILVEFQLLKKVIHSYEKIIHPVAIESDTLVRKIIHPVVISTRERQSELFPCTLYSDPHGV